MKFLIYSSIYFLLQFSLHSQQNISLITPSDKDTIETKYPLLSWFYLDGMRPAERATYYRILLTELKEKQSAEAGIILNRPLLKIDRLKSTQLFYPYDAPELEEGHRYGWQIQKIQNNITIDKSEAWEFTLPMPEIPKACYHRMNVKPNSNMCNAFDGKLLFYFEEDYNAGVLDFYLYDDRGNLLDVEVTRNPEKNFEVQRVNEKRTGANYFEIDLGSSAPLGMYRLLVKGAKNQKYHLLFNLQ
tara:strand:- start:38 stop:769 length:732 start_codon:yes stop_codon:yes gene_type:complete